MAGPPPEGMVACSICKRNFNEDRIAKHEVICKKTTTKKRKIFDVTKQRVEVRKNLYNILAFIFFFFKRQYCSILIQSILSQKYLYSVGRSFIII